MKKSISIFVLYVGLIFTCLAQSEGLATVYIVHPSKAMMFGLGANHKSGEQLLGTTHRKEYLKLQFEPGEITFDVSQEYYASSAKTMILESGMTYFLALEIKLNKHNAKLKYQEIDTATGEKYISKYKCANL